MDRERSTKLINTFRYLYLYMWGMLGPETDTMLDLGSLWDFVALYRLEEGLECVDVSYPGDQVGPLAISWRVFPEVAKNMNSFASERRGSEPKFRVPRLPVE